MKKNERSFKNPPLFVETLTYEAWKEEIQMWKLVTDLSKEKQAIAVVLTLSGKAKEKAKELKSDELHKEDGTDKLFAKLDEIFKKDELDGAYEAYYKFEHFTKSEDISMMAYIVEFEQLNARVKKFNMTLPDSVLGFKLLDNSGLDKKDRQIVLSSNKTLTYDNIKSSLKRIFGDEVINKDEKKTENNENVLFNKKFRKYQNKYSVERKTFNKTNLNPFDKFHKRMKCNICQSFYHLMRDCPENTAERYKNQNQTKPNFFQKRKMNDERVTFYNDYD